jgi:hypothetical protein
MAAKVCGRCIRIPQSWFNWQTTLLSMAKGVDHEMLEGLRSDAFQIRLCVMLALGTIHAVRFVGRSIRECPSRGRNLQRDAGQAHRVHPGILNPLFPSYLNAVA